MMKSLAIMSVWAEEIAEIASLVIKAVFPAILQVFSIFLSGRA